MLRIAGMIFLAAGAAIALAADSSTQPATTPATRPAFARDAWLDVAGGKLMLRAFDTAPYPHPSRESGYKNSAGESFSRDEHYTDSTVGLFIPPGFDPAAEVNYVVVFHGHRNEVANVLAQFHLMEQMAESKVNAILLVPQGPLYAPDSGGGKLELDDDGFKRFITQITRFLIDEKVLTSDRIGHIALAPHSGGYKVTAGVLHRGGLTDHITDVLLLDASYGSLPWFVEYLQQHPSGRLVSFHTKHLDEENIELQRLMAEQNIPAQVLKEDALDQESLSRRGATFVATTKSHGAVPVEYFLPALRASDLPSRK